MNTREVCALNTLIQTAFSFELADELDKHITGFNLQWNRGNGCFTIREQDRPGVRHSRIAMELYISSELPRLLFTHYSFPEKRDHRMHCQNQKEYDLSDSRNDPESIGKEIAQMLDSTLPYWRVIAFNQSEEDPT